MPRSDSYPKPCFCSLGKYSGVVAPPRSSYLGWQFLTTKDNPCQQRTNYVDIDQFLSTSLQATESIDYAGICPNVLTVTALTRAIEKTDSRITIQNESHGLPENANWKGREQGGGRLQDRSKLDPPPTMLGHKSVF